MMAKPMKTLVLSNDLFFDKVEILANGKCYAEIRWNCKNLLKPAKSFRFHWIFVNIDQSNALLLIDSVYFVH